MEKLVDSATILGASTKTEVFYPLEFSDASPDGTSPPLPDCWERDYLSLPITHLSHVTHEWQASSIKSDESFYCFKPRRMFGKEIPKDGKKIGMTYVKISEDAFKSMPTSEPVFPGYISWWGINFQNCNQEFQTILSGIHETKGKNSVSEAGYLVSPPTSIFGTNGFSFSLYDMMESYKRSRTDCTSDTIYLKKAGTLRYPFEACYVVMVVMLEDLSNEDIQKMPSTYGEFSLGHNGCIDVDGKLNGKESLSFNIRRPFSWIENQNGAVLWEFMGFAFYFPNNQAFWCPKQTGEEFKVIHDPERCRFSPCPNTLRKS